MPIRGTVNTQEFFHLPGLFCVLTTTCTDADSGLTRYSNVRRSASNDSLSNFGTSWTLKKEISFCLMAPATKVAEFRREGSDWFCYAGLPSDVVVTVGGVNFHLHKFPLIYRSGKMVKQFEESHEGHRNSVILDEFPGDAETFLTAVKFCYGLRIELTPRNVVMVHCAADYLEMIDEYGEENLFSKCESYLHKNIFRSWKECMLALQSSEPIIRWAEKLQIVSKCCDAISTMVCTDPSLFGWPMMMYGSLQSPGGSILWNGINTGARIRSVESKWWYEDISYLSIDLFVKLINTMESRGIRPENIAGAIMYYTRRYLPGLGRWHGVHSGISRAVASFSMTPASVDQRVLLESIVKLLPQKKSKSYCRFLLGLLRVGLILDINKKCRDSLEGRIGMQLELATLDSLLIPSYSDSDTLYDTDCIQRIIQHFLSSEQSSTLFSPTSLEIEASPSSEPSRQVAKLVDSYIAEVASDVNLKPEKIQALAKALPEASRSLHDGLYRALDIFLKAHPWLSDRDKEQLCNIIDYQKLSIDACAHASQNERLPLRVVLQVLFFEQMQLRTALAGCLHVVDAESVPGDAITVQNDMAGHIIRRDGWITIAHENNALNADLQIMRSKVQALEEEFDKIKQDMKKISKSQRSLSSPRLVERSIGHRLLQQSSEALHTENIEGKAPTPRASIEGQSSRHLRHRKNSSLS